MESKEILRVLGSFAEFYGNLQSLIEIYRAYRQSRFQKSWGYSMVECLQDFYKAIRKT